MRDATMTDRPSANQIVGGILGAVYLLVGLVGFAVTNGVDFAARDGDHLLGVFEINPLHNIIHLAVGAALLLSALKGRIASRTMNTIVGATYLLVGLVGLFVLDRPANILALNAADNVLHLGTAAVLLGLALLESGGRATDTRIAGERATTRSGGRGGTV